MNFAANGAGTVNIFPSTVKVLPQADTVRVTVIHMNLLDITFRCREAIGDKHYLRERTLAFIDIAEIVGNDTALTIVIEKDKKLIDEDEKLISNANQCMEIIRDLQFQLTIFRKGFK